MKERGLLPSRLWLSTRMRHICHVKASEEAEAPASSLQGQRALDFVLRNQGLIDKTLMFDIELVKVS